MLHVLLLRCMQDAANMKHSRCLQMILPLFITGAEAALLYIFMECCLDLLDEFPNSRTERLSSFPCKDRSGRQLGFQRTYHDL